MTETSFRRKELAACEHFARGLDVREVAAQMKIAQTTAWRYLEDVRRHLGAESHSQMIDILRERGLIR